MKTEGCQVPLKGDAVVHLNQADLAKRWRLSPSVGDGLGAVLAYSKLAGGVCTDWKTSRHLKPTDCGARPFGGGRFENAAKRQSHDSPRGRRVKLSAIASAALLYLPLLLKRQPVTEVRATS